MMFHKPLRMPASAAMRILPASLARLGHLCRCREDPDEWLRVSEGALDRIAKHYTWDNYAERLLTLQNIYAFWRHSTHMEHKVGGPGSGEGDAMLYIRARVQVLVGKWDAG